MWQCGVFVSRAIRGKVCPPKQPLRFRFGQIGSESECRPRFLTALHISVHDWWRRLRGFDRWDAGSGSLSRTAVRRWVTAMAANRLIEGALHNTRWLVLSSSSHLALHSSETGLDPLRSVRWSHALPRPACFKLR